LLLLRSGSSGWGLVPVGHGAVSQHPEFERRLEVPPTRCWPPVWSSLQRTRTASESAHHPERTRMLITHLAKVISLMTLLSLLYRVLPEPTPVRSPGPSLNPRAHVASSPCARPRTKASCSGSWSFRKPAKHSLFEPRRTPQARPGWCSCRATARTLVSERRSGCWMEKERRRRTDVR